MSHLLFTLEIIFFNVRYKHIYWTTHFQRIYFRNFPSNFHFTEQPEIIDILDVRRKDFQFNSHHLKYARGSSGVCVPSDASTNCKKLFRLLSRAGINFLRLVPPAPFSLGKKLSQLFVLSCEKKKKTGTLKYLSDQTRTSSTGT